MDDPELQALRAQRMADLQKQGGVAGGAGELGKGPGPHSSNAESKAQAASERAAKEEEMRNAILTQVLDQNARARINTIAAAKPEKARQLEHMIINMARYGKIPGKLTDEQLRSLLDQVAEHRPSKTTTVKFDRRRAAIDSDDEDF